MKVVEYMENNDGLIVIHGTGCGKTLTAITTTQCYLDKYPSRGVVFVGPTSLISNFQKEMKAYGVKNTDKYEFYSYDKIRLVVQFLLRINS
jgi:ERCC4-related helicase